MGSEGPRRRRLPHLVPGRALRQRATRRRSPSSSSSRPTARRGRTVGGRPNVYYGGVSEVAFEFDADGSLWAVTRNEDGDASGFGSHVCYAPARRPRRLAMLRRRPIPTATTRPRCSATATTSTWWPGATSADRTTPATTTSRSPSAAARYLIAYSLRPKRTALYKIDKAGAARHARRRSAGRRRHVLPVGPADRARHVPARQLHVAARRCPTSPGCAGRPARAARRSTCSTLTFVPYPGPPRTPTPTWTPTPSPTARPIETEIQVVMTPVFAAPGAPLSIIRGRARRTSSA